MQRLFRAYVSHTQLPKRLISAAAAPNPRRDVPKDKPLHGQPSSEPSKRKPNLLDNDVLKAASAALKGDAPSFVSSLHPSLQEGYKLGGRMNRGKVLGVSDEEGMRMWGEWGIPIGFVSLQRPETAIL